MQSVLLEARPGFQPVTPAQGWGHTQQGPSPRLDSTLLAALVYDVRNPLAHIRAGAQILRRRVTGPGILDRVQLADGLALIEVPTARMAVLLEELVDLSRTGRQPGPVVGRPTDLARIARSLAEYYQHMTDRHQLRVETPVQGVVGLWDPARLERVVSNLLSNAVKYSPAGGDIVVEVREAADRDGGHRWGTLRVGDTGLGIPATDLPKIFEEHHPGENVGRVSSTGLGLATAQRMVAEHGGTITVESQEGRGSTFTVWLPLNLLDNSAEPVS
jgi:signal transduction histidine kinase